MRKRERIENNMQLKDVLDKNILSLNERNYQALKEKVSEDKVTWILGAGVSVPAGLPGWNTLLAKMWARLSEIDPGANTRADEDEKAFVKARQDKLNQITNHRKFREKIKNAYMGKDDNIFSGINVLESAEYMWNYIENLISGDLGAEEKKKLQKQILKELVRNSLSIDKESEDLKACLANQAVGKLAKLLKKRKRGTIITYNYDDIAEFCLCEMAGLTEKEVSVVCDCDLEKHDTNKKIHINHPHGALKIVNSKLGKESEEIVLTEDSYYELEREAYRWENSVQANALVETSCVFMGFSGDDYNFRRIIKNIGSKQKETPNKHYIFICINDLIKRICGSDLAKLHEERYLYINIQLINRLYAQYSYWNNQGIIPIWSTYDELPDMIAGL